MKVGLITGDAGSVRSGMHNYIFNLIDRLKKNPDLDLTLITYEKQTIFPDIPNKTPSYPFPGFSPFFWSQFLSLQKNMFRGFDIVHNPAHYPLLNKPSAKYICTIHDITPVSHPQFHSRWRSFYNRIALPRLVKYSDKIITDSLQTKKDLISYYSVPDNKISVIYLGASQEFKKLDTNATDAIRQKHNLHDPFVLFVGNLEPRKNIPNLIRAFAQCRKQRPELKLVISGRKGWMFGEIFNTIAELRVEKSVRFLDYVPHEDLPALYNAASIFVYIPFYEGFGLPPLEAMQCGIPVITSNTSSLPEIMGDEGIMVDPNDIPDLVDKMNLLLTDDKARRENILYNLSRCQQFSWDKCAHQTMKIYEEVLNKPETN